MHVPIEFHTISPDRPYTTLVLYSSPTPTCLLMNSPTGGEVRMVLAVLPSFLELGEPRSPMPGADLGIWHGRTDGWQVWTDQPLPASCRLPASQSQLPDACSDEMLLPSPAAHSSCTPVCPILHMAPQDVCRGRNVMRVAIGKVQWLVEQKLQKEACRGVNKISQWGKRISEFGRKHQWS